MTIIKTGCEVTHGGNDLMNGKAVVDLDIVHFHFAILTQNKE